ncbi:MAG: hypothetical protein IKI40_09170 [Treponema sp.]|nr:hypothetical protein [Treponema sp.]
MDEYVRKKIEFEISQIDTLLSKAEVLAQKCKLQTPDFIELSAAGATLHSYYNGLENIFILIGKHVDNMTFSSQRWHKELLDSMFSKTTNREPILEESIHEQLLDYMSFRHVFRHSYGYALDWNRLKPLFSALNENWKNVKSDIIKFTGQPLESPPPTARR